MPSPRRRKDKFSKVQRSIIMSRIRSRFTKLDLAMRSLLLKEGIKFRMYPRLEGNPDFLLGTKIAVFCDSSFWHGRNWRRLKAQLLRGSNPEYWVSHIARNRMRDLRVNRILRRDGYTVLRFWDSEIFERPGSCLREIERAISSKR